MEEGRGGQGAGGGLGAKARLQGPGEADGATATAEAEEDKLSAEDLLSTLAVVVQVRWGGWRGGIGFVVTYEALAR